ncbi:MAG: class I SAM-dependent methyltransferase [Candidatus Nanohaloarchaea archaeon]
MTQETKKYYTRIAEEYAENQSFEALPKQAEKNLKTYLQNFLRQLNGDKVLDAGCGTGRDAEYMAGRSLEAIGVDSAPGMIEKAREREHRARYAVMDIRDLSFPDNSFNGVWCNTVLQFIPPQHLEKTVNELQRVLKPGGTLFNTFKVGGEHRNPEPQRYTVKEEKGLKLLKQAGLKPQETNHYAANGMKTAAILSTNEEDR